MDRFVILGSSNAVAKSGQDNTHLYVQSGNKKILVDCGNNPMAKLADAGVSATEITDLVLTHFHADHIGSLPLLIMDMWLEKRQALLTIHGLRVTLTKAKQLLDLFGWQEWKNMYPVVFHEVADEQVEEVINGTDIRVVAGLVQHLIPTIGLRFEFGSGRVVTYSCDTEPCEALMTLAKGADVLLQESAGDSKGHTSAAQAGEIASRAGNKKLILIHYERRAGEEQLLLDARRTFRGEILLARDLLEV